MTARREATGSREENRPKMPRSPGWGFPWTSGCTLPKALPRGRTYEPWRAGGNSWVRSNG